MLSVLEVAHPATASTRGAKSERKESIRSGRFKFEGLFLTRGLEPAFGRCGS